MRCTPPPAGPEALTVLIGWSPDLIVSDLVMDEMDGHEFHRRVRTLTGARCHSCS